MEEEIEVRLEDLQLVEIQELLEEHGIELGEEEIADLTRFVKEAGGIETALETLAHLANQKGVA